MFLLLVFVPAACFALQVLVGFFAPKCGRVATAAIVAAATYTPIWLMMSVAGVIKGDQSFVMGPPVWTAVAVGLVVVAGATRRTAWGRSALVALFLFASAIPIPSVGHSEFYETADANPPPLDRSASPVIVIVLDTLRAGHLGTYGYERPTSPHIDEFARSAMVYEWAISTSPWTVPAHGSILTGLPPRSHGAHLGGDRLASSLVLPPEVVTLAEAFRLAGYRTAAAVSNSWLRRGSGFEQDFDAYFDAPRHTIVVPPWLWMSANLIQGAPLIGSLADRVLAATWVPFLPYPSFREIADAAAHWIRASPREPFLLFMNAMETHDPFESPPPVRDRFPGRIRGKVPFHHVRAEVMSGRTEIDPRVLAHLVSQYDGAIEFLGAQIGAFFEALMEMGVYDRAWIVITSDHGEHFGEHGLLWHRTSVEDELLRVPLIVKAPGQNIGRREARTVQPSDAMPTLLRANGIEPPEPIREGGLETPADEVFAELYHDRWIVERHGDAWARDWLAYERLGRKLVVSSAGEVEVYDAGRRLAEPTSGAAGHALDRAEMMRAMEVRIAEFPPPPTQGKTKERDDDTLQRPRALGYVQ